MSDQLEYRDNEPVPEMSSEEFSESICSIKHRDDFKTGDRILCPNGAEYPLGGTVLFIEADKVVFKLDGFKGSIFRAKKSALAMM